MMLKIFLSIVLLPLLSYGQEKYNSTHFIEQRNYEWNDYEMAGTGNLGKTYSVKNEKVLDFSPTFTETLSSTGFPKNDLLKNFAKVSKDDSNINAIVKLSWTEKIKMFCKVWGFIKYYNEKIASGKDDWDSVFVSRLTILNSLNSDEKIKKFYDDWFKSLGINKDCNSCNLSVNKAIQPTENFGWIGDTRIFSSNAKEILRQWKNNPLRQGNFYVQQDSDVGNAVFTNEKEYKDSIYPSLPFRLLTLARYWNMVEYFYPYKHLVGKPWDNVLADMIPIFTNARDTISYNMAIATMAASLNDSHAGFVSLYTNHYFGYKYAPFKFKIIDGNAVVTSYYDEELCRRNKISIGDVFTRINGIKIISLIKQYSKFIGASNEAFRLWSMQNTLFRGNSDSLQITEKTSHGERERTIKLYYFNFFNDTSAKKDTVKILNGDIAYINLGLLTEERTEFFLRKILDKKAIIFDARAYPNWTLYKITGILNDSIYPFAKTIIPDLDFPGTFKKGKLLKCGRVNKQFYKGLVIILINEQTISQGEFTVMALKTIPHAITIGSQTAGTDGNISQISLPGNYKTQITGTGIYYPDGSLTQRTGIIPDITVKQTIAGIQNGKDEQLEAAIKLIHLRIKEKKVNL